MKQHTKIRSIKVGIWGLGLLIGAVIVFTLWFVYYSVSLANKDYDYSPKSSSTSNAISTANIVVDPQDGSTDLIAYLKRNDTGCNSETGQGNGWFRVVKEINSNQAELEYGCSRTYANGNGTPARILAVKTTSQWQLISPTNQWLYTVPSCTMLQSNHIFAMLEPQCWTKQTTMGATVVDNQISQYASNYASCSTAAGSTVAQKTGLCVTKDHVVFSK